MDDLCYAVRSLSSRDSGKTFALGIGTRNGSLGTMLGCWDSLPSDQRRWLWWGMGVVTNWHRLATRARRQAMNGRHWLVLGRNLD